MKASQDPGSSPPRSGGEVARAKPETVRGATDVPSRRSPEMSPPHRLATLGTSPQLCWGEEPKTVNAP